MTFSLWHSTVSEMTYDNNDYDRNTSPHAAFMHTWQLTYLVCAPCYSCTWFVLRSSDTDSFTRQNNSFADTRRLGVIVDILRTFYNERGLLWLWVEPIGAILTTIRGDHDVPSRSKRFLDVQEIHTIDVQLSCLLASVIIDLHFFITWFLLLLTTASSA